MPLNAEAILVHRFPEIRQSYTERDAILYALGIGLGADPLDAYDLRFLLETKLDVLPTMAVTLGTPGLWVAQPALGIDVPMVVHASQSATFHAMLPARADIAASARVASLSDRGPGKGAVLVVERSIRDAAHDVLYCTLQQTLLLRGDGGFGGPPPSPTPPLAVPERAPDHVVAFSTSKRAALIYRLSGDWNPLHADPEMASRAGFTRPILHGLASYGIAGWVLLHQCAGANPAALRALSCRFCGPVTPGETIDFVIWHGEDAITFEGHVAGRKVLDRGRAEIMDASKNDK